MKPGVAMRYVAVPLLTCLILCAAPLAAGAEPITREQAVQALSSADLEARREGAVALGKLGTMADVPALLDALYDADGGTRALAESAVWQVWMRSGDPAVDKLLKDGIRQMEEGHMGQAVDSFTRVIERRPEFAEGWNKRATAYYLMGDLDQSLKDCDEVIERNPSHFGALSGYGLIYTAKGELEKALSYFERAIQINPNMPGVQQSIEMIQYRLGKSGKRST
jgi:tetratricopeptide (TPR) repeat protein